MAQLILDLPESIPAEEARLEMAIGLYRSGKLKQGDAAQLAALAPSAFVETLASRDIPAVRIDLGEVEEQLTQMRARDARWRKVIAIAALSVVGAFFLWMFLVCSGAFDFSKRRFHAVRNAAWMIAREWDPSAVETRQSVDAILAKNQATYSTVEFYRFSGDSLDGVILVPTGVFHRSLTTPRILITTDEFETIEERPVRRMGW